MIFRKPKPPLLAVLPGPVSREVADVISDSLDTARDCDDAMIVVPAGVTILQCVNGEWIPLPIPEPEADEPPQGRRTLG